MTEYQAGQYGIELGLRMVGGVARHLRHPILECSKNHIVGIVVAVVVVFGPTNNNLLWLNSTRKRRRSTSATPIHHVCIPTWYIRK